MKKENFKCFIQQARKCVFLVWESEILSFTTPCRFLFFCPLQFEASSRNCSQIVSREHSHTLTDHRMPKQKATLCCCEDECACVRVCACVCVCVTERTFFWFGFVVYPDSICFQNGMQFVPVMHLEMSSFIILLRPNCCWIPLKRLQPIKPSAALLCTSQPEESGSDRKKADLTFKTPDWKRNKSQILLAASPRTVKIADFVLCPGILCHEDLRKNRNVSVKFVGGSGMVQEAVVSCGPSQMCEF